MLQGHGASWAALRAAPQRPRGTPARLLVLARPAPGARAPLPTSPRHHVPALLP